MARWSTWAAATVIAMHLSSVKLGREGLKSCSELNMEYTSANHIIIDRLPQDSPRNTLTRPSCLLAPQHASTRAPVRADLAIDLEARGRSRCHTQCWPETSNAAIRQSI
jgi:hypothetical protein